MKCTPRQKFYIAAASGIFAIHLVVAWLAKPSFGLTVSGDAIPCALVVLAILGIRENFSNAPGILPVFWKVFAAGLGVLLLSQIFWFYFDWRRLTPAPNPVLGDSLFLVAHVFFLAALAVRPHAASTGRDLRIRGLDFMVLSLWWLCLYGYFAWPWQIVVRNLNQYYRTYYLLTLLEHLLIIVALASLSLRKTGWWRIFYLQLLAAFVLIAAGNFVMSMAIDAGRYYAGSHYDTLFFAGLYLLTWTGTLGPSLQPQEDTTPNRELVLNVWTARFAMLVMLSLPAIALWGFRVKDLPHSIVIFRLRLIFGSMFVLGSLVYWKLTVLTRELVRLVRLTHTSIENLKTVQQQMSHSEKFVALGRLAAGAAHEISNPLTAILGYSELLADIPSLSAEDQMQAREVREQVHRAQAAVASLRNNMRLTLSPGPLSSSLPVDKKTFS